MGNSSEQAPAPATSDAGVSGEPPTRKRHPRGVILIALLALLSGVITLLAAALYLVVGVAILSGAGSSLPSAVVGAAPSGLTAVLLGVAYLISALADLSFFAGALLLRPWAWFLGIALQSLHCLVAIGEVIFHELSWGPTLSFAVSVFILFYLYDMPIRQSFTVRSRPDWQAALHALEWRALFGESA